MSDNDPSRRSLWDVLHDAHLVTIEADSMMRRLSILVDVPHLRAFAHLGDDVRWRLTVDGASLLVARTWEPWPGPVPNQKGLSREQETAVVADYQAKGRTVSLTWRDFELATNSNGMCLKDATLQEVESGVVLSGYGHDNKTDRFLEFEVAGQALRCERTDVGPLALSRTAAAG